MATEFEVKHPLPPRRAHQALRDQLIEFLLRERPKVGDRFLSDHQLVRASHLSRPTVRRALEELSREGWIERRHGQGTFVGPRVALAAHARQPHTDGKAKTTGRLAVLMHFPGGRATDWQSSGVLDGMDEVASSLDITIELLGSRDGSPDAISRRLGRSRPDVLVAISPKPEQAFVLADAKRLGVPVFMTGSRLLALGLPTVREDGHQGARLAVQHLVEHGHRRIGFAQIAAPVHWAFERREGYLSGLDDAGIPRDENLVAWCGPEFSPMVAEQFQNYLRKQKPTAVVIGSHTILLALRAVVERGHMHIPDDVSIVCFDQVWDLEPWVGGGRPTTVAQPLQEMGRRLVTLARQTIDGDRIEPPPPLPCTLQPGCTVGKCPS